MRSMEMNGTEMMQAKTKKRWSDSTWARVGLYTLTRLTALFFTVVVAIYLTILIANMGGAMDDIRTSMIRENISMAMSMDPEMRQLSSGERNVMIQDAIRIEIARLGLDQPFPLRSVRYLSNALLLDLGRAEYLTSDAGSRQVKLIILERLPPTLLLFATSNLLLFFITLFAALFLSRRYGSTLDKIVVALAPTSAAPSWFYGIFLILLFAGIWGVLPFGGMVGAPPPPTTWAYSLSVLRHLILPVMALTLAALFLQIYSWRTFFLIYSSEDYVEMAKAKGLSSSAIERRYILRPTLPTILTSFTLGLITMWMGGVVTETIFNWPGLGSLIYAAATMPDTPVVVGSVVIYAYLLAASVFVLDIMYAVVDPRVKVGGGSRS